VELTEYARKKKVTTPNEIKGSIHYITLFKSEEIYSLKNMEDYQLTINESDKAVSIKKERKIIEKDINYLRGKGDRFRIWKEEFTNMKEIIDILDPNNSQYAIQLKENNYLLWKFKKKWRGFS
jgi:hypothetical protein